MSDLDVRIVKLPPMRVASVRVISKTPERDAWERLRTWAAPQRLLEDIEMYPVFGFNNPGPEAGREEYGYEFWIRIDADTSPEGEVEAKEFAGGTYAVLSCKLHGDPCGSILEVWHRLLGWVESSEYKWRKTHELERHLNPLAPEEEMVLDLYLPIEQ